MYDQELLLSGDFFLSYEFILFIYLRSHVADVMCMVGRECLMYNILRCPFSGKLWESLGVEWRN